MQLNIMLNLIKSYLLPSEFSEEIPSERFIEVLALMQKYNIGHLAGVVLSGNPAYQSWEDTFFNMQYLAMLQYEKGQYAKEQVFQAFEAHKIPYLPLKGSTIAGLYREPWHRTSCDVDILVLKEHLEKAAFLLEKELCFTYRKKSEHDISFVSSNGVVVELHYDLHEESLPVSELWEDAMQEDGKCRYNSSAEMVILYHLAHMAKHFVNGGCGFRPFIDLWLMKHGMQYDAKRLEEKLANHGLKKFSEAMFSLLKVWFGEEQSNATLDTIASYLLEGKAYGSVENKVAIGRMQKKNRHNYIFHRIFLPYDALRYQYPILEKHRFLLPFCHVRRWVRLLLTRFSRVRDEFRINRQVSSEEIKSIRNMLEELGLLK